MLLPTTHCIASDRKQNYVYVFSFKFVFYTFQQSSAGTGSSCSTGGTGVSSISQPPPEPFDQSFHLESSFIASEVSSAPYIPETLSHPKMFCGRKKHEDVVWTMPGINLSIL